MSKKFGNITKLRQWLRTTKAQEGVTIDFKESIPDPFVVRKIFSAFANTEGGFIYFGISDTKQVIGITITVQQLKDRISQILGSDVSPADIGFEVVEEIRFDSSRKSIQIVQVKKSPYTEKPHLVIKNGAVYIPVRKGALCEHLTNQVEIRSAFLLEGAFYSQQLSDVKRILQRIERMPSCQLSYLEKTVLNRSHTYLSQESSYDRRAGVLLIEMRGILEDHNNLGTSTALSITEMAHYLSQQKALQARILKHLSDFSKHYE